MEKKGIIHIIDDEPIIYEVLQDILTSEGYAVEISSNGEEALEKHSSLNVDLILLDLLMPGMDGIEVLKRLKKIEPNVVVIIITAYASIESAISAMKTGAYDYIQKPFKHAELLLAVERAITHRRLQEENLRLKDELKRKFSFEKIIGKSELMNDIFEIIKASAPTRSTILIQGESGTGKELVARAVHLNSDRAGFPFIIVNSGSLPPDLLESHVFGHVKGAFTGAINDKQGLFEAAHKGTIFFDEISSLNLDTQAKLLRVMQDREFMKLGGTKTIRVDARVIAATNTDLEDLIRIQKFREDLFYRLNVIKIELPPLRHHKEDIPLLTKHFLDMYSNENNRDILGISDEVVEILDNYDWPGNIRELENLIERAVVLTKSKIITRENLPSFLLPSYKEETTSFASSSDDLNLKGQIQEYQRQAIINALKKSKGVQKKAVPLYPKRKIKCPFELNHIQLQQVALIGFFHKMCDLDIGKSIGLEPTIKKHTQVFPRDLLECAEEFFRTWSSVFVSVEKFPQCMKKHILSQYIFEHIQHHGGLVVDNSLIRLKIIIADTRAQHDGPPFGFLPCPGRKFLHDLAVSFLAIFFSEIDDRGKLRQSLAEPLIVVGAPTQTLPPPLVGDLVGDEILLPPAEIHRTAFGLEAALADNSGPFVKNDE
jgi:two-component system response regulator PilR (NtrC family)